MSELYANDDENPPSSHPNPPRTILPSGKAAPTRDITTEFSQAVRALHVGDVVQDGNFTLFEAVGALEIMDPKMDSGYLQDGESHEPEYDVLQVLSAKQIIGIMDQLLCFEMAWHKGFALTQTLFASLYIDRLLWPKPYSLREATFDHKLEPDGSDTLVHLVLRAYCLGLIKTCDSVHRRIYVEKIYEEEDFISQLYGRDLLSEISVREVEDLLDEAINHVEALSSLISGAEIEHEVLLMRAIALRLELRVHLLRASKEENLTWHAQDSWKSALRLTRDLEDTHELGEPVPDAYSIKLQRRLATTTPPRPLVELPWDDATSCLGLMVTGGVMVYYVMTISGCSNVLTFVRLFSSGGGNDQIEQPPIYIRCVLQTLLWHDTKVLNNIPYEVFMRDDLIESVLPVSVWTDPHTYEVEAPQDPRFKIARIIENFLRRSADAFLDIYMTLCMNRARVRRMLCHLALEWDKIEEEARLVDEELREYGDEEPSPPSSNEATWLDPFSTWARLHKLRIMMWIVQLGFELNVYLPDELAGMYWYLQSLGREKVMVLAHIQHHSLCKLNATATHHKRRRGKLACHLHATELRIEETRAIIDLADGLSTLYSFFAHIGLIPSPIHPYDYSSPELRYRLRVKPFASIRDPEVPSFRKYVTLTSLTAAEGTLSEVREVMQADQRQQSMGILELASTAVQEAKEKWVGMTKWNLADAECADFEAFWQIDVKRVVKACIQTNLAVMNAKKAVESARPDNVREQMLVDIPAAADSHHAWWIAPKILMKP